MPLVLSILLTHTAHEWPRLACFLKADKLNSMDLMLQAQSLLMRLVSQGHTTVFGQCAGGMGELGAVSTQVGSTHGAVHGSRVAFILITADYTLEEKEMFLRREYTMPVKMNTICQIQSKTIITVLLLPCP